MVCALYRFNYDQAVEAVCRCFRSLQELLTGPCVNPFVSNWPRTIGGAFGAIGWARDLVCWSTRQGNSGNSKIGSGRAGGIMRQARSVKAICCCQRQQNSSIDAINCFLKCVRSIQNRNRAIQFAYSRADACSRHVCARTGRKPTAKPHHTH